MAELSTIARPYAQGLWKALADRGDTAQAAEIEQSLFALSSAVSEPQVAELVSDPKVTDDQMYDLLAGSIGEEAPSELKGLLRTVIENGRLCGRLCALPEIAAQFRALKNESEGVADAYIESAYALTKKDVDQLVKALSTKFPGVTLRPEVSINKDLIGGVSIRVGDQVLDGSVRARLAQMKAALTA